MQTSLKLTENVAKKYRWPGRRCQKMYRCRGRQSCEIGDKDKEMNHLVEGKF